jgi:tetratricopeptide (TPR) repeat protein
MKARSVVVAAALAAVSGWGCGDAPPAKAPTKPTGPVAHMPTAAPGQPAPQFAVPDAPPPPSEEPVAARPTMNAQALGFYQQGLAAFANGELAAAVSGFTQATQADPKAFQAFYSLGVVQERLGSPAASESYRRAYGLVPDYEPAIVAHGVLQAKSGNTAEADAFLNDMRGRFPKSAAITAALAEVKSLAKDTASAQRLAQEALKLNPGQKSAMMVIARDHYRNRRLDLALYALKAILDGLGGDNPPRDKDNAEAHMLRAYILLEQGNRPQAMESFKRAMELRPDFVPARVQLATYLLESGSAEEALPILVRAAQYDDDNPAIRLSLGDAYRLTGKFDLAKREFEWVRQKQPNEPQVHYNLGLLYLFAPSVPGMTPKQQVEAAMESITKFKELRRKTDPDDHEELLRRATLKKSEIDALEKANQPQPAQPAAGKAVPGDDEGDEGTKPAPAPAPAKAPAEAAPADDEGDE